MIVKIDETLFTKRKRILQYQWIFGCVCCETNECFQNRICYLHLDSYFAAFMWRKTAEDPFYQTFNDIKTFWDLQ